MFFLNFFSLQWIKLNEVTKLFNFFSVGCIEWREIGAYNHEKTIIHTIAISPSVSIHGVIYTY